MLSWYGHGGSLGNGCVGMDILVVFSLMLLGIAVFGEARYYCLSMGALENGQALFDPICICSDLTMDGLGHGWLG